MVARREEEEDLTTGASGYRYDVFLSFRGKDTRLAFTDHLYTALWNAGFDTFRDEEGVEGGECLKSELKKAINGSRASIIVLSDNYASSVWCLDELLLILERRTNFKHIVLPVFYHVRPSDVRNLRDKFGEAFAEYEDDIKAVLNPKRKWQLMHKLDRWKGALIEVANIKGMVLQHGHEARFIESIVREIRIKLDHKPLSVPQHLVGLQTQVQGINRWLLDESSDSNVLIIYGIGGVGKTTMAIYVYNMNFLRFESTSFLAEIREISKQPNGLLGLQNQLLVDILNGARQKAKNVHEGTSKIEKALLCKKAFVILDDVDDISQVRALLGTNKLCQGTKILVTSRIKLDLPGLKTCTQQMQELNHHESLELLSWHAFGFPQPLIEYENVSKKLLEYCVGIPVALEVLGSSLFGSNINAWESTLELLKRETNPKIQNVLKISYDSLHYDSYKNLFLDIACFFVGEERDYVEKILEPDFSASAGIQVLISRCLLTIGPSNRLMMHLLLREMAREVVRQESPKRPEKRSRLWRHMDSFNVLMKEKGTDAIEGLLLDKHMLKKEKSPNQVPLVLCSSKSKSKAFKPSMEVLVNTRAFASMERLTLLQINYVHLTGSYENFPKGLRWLCWCGFPSKTMPVDIPMENLVALDLKFSKLEQVWHEPKRLPLLKILDLSDSNELVRTPDFSAIPNLETLSLRNCIRLSEVCESIGNLKKLALLDLRNCTCLRKLPTNIHMLKSLEKLLVDGCSNGGGFPMVPKELLVDGISKFREFFPSLSMSLVHLSLVDCKLSTDSFPEDFDRMSLLEYLDISLNQIVSLPNGIKGLQRIKKLKMSRCLRLETVFCLPSTLIYLDMTFSSSVAKITFNPALCRVPKIALFGCHQLSEIEGIFKVEPIADIDKHMIDTLGFSELLSIQNLELSLKCNHVKEKYLKRPIQIIHEFGILNTFFRGRQVPRWFSGTCTENPSLLFVVPKCVNSIIGLRICSVYMLKEVHNSYPLPLFIRVSNMINDLDWIYQPSIYGDPEPGEHIVWINHWMFENSQLGEGDIIGVSIIVGDGMVVKEFGVEFVNHDELTKKESQKNKNKFSSKEKIGGDLSAFQLSSRTFFLSHHSFGEKTSPMTEWNNVDWFQKLVGGTTQIEELQKWDQFGGRRA